MAATASARADTAPTSTLDRIKKSDLLRIAAIRRSGSLFPQGPRDQADDIPGEVQF